MGKEPEIPDKLWSVVLTKLNHVEHLCEAHMSILSYNRLKETIGIMGCLQYRFEA